MNRFAEKLDFITQQVGALIHVVGDPEYTAAVEESVVFLEQI